MSKKSCRRETCAVCGEQLCGQVAWLPELVLPGAKGVCVRCFDAAATPRMRQLAKKDRKHHARFWRANRFKTFASERERQR
jgi:hypothetical protein